MGFLPVWEGAVVKPALIKFASERSFPWLHPINQSKGQAQWYLRCLLKHNAADNDDGEQQERKGEGGRLRDVC